MSNKTLESMSVKSEGEDRIKELPKGTTLDFVKGFGKGLIYFHREIWHRYGLENTPEEGFSMPHPRTQKEFYGEITGATTSIVGAFGLATWGVYYFSTKK